MATEPGAQRVAVGDQHFLEKRAQICPDKLGHG